MTMTLNRWNAARPLEDFQHNLLTAFPPVGVFYSLNGGSTTSQTPASWTPAMDMIENDKGYLITAEVPGVKKEDITVMLENDVVTVRGERKSVRTDETDSDTWHMNERQFGPFGRTIPLPKDVDTSTLKAELNEGVLCLQLDKKQEARPRLIEVN